MTNATPAEHSSVVGGSTAARRLNCPASYALEQLAPPDRGNAYAREGTALHEMMAIILGQGKEPDDLLPFTFSREAKGAEPAFTLVVDEQLWYDIGQPALDAFDDFIAEIEAETGAEFEYVVEIRCEMPGIEGAFGTSDIVWRCGDLSGVWDWKFGRTPVPVEKSGQLMFYARAAINTKPIMFGGETWGQIAQDREIVMTICQPQSHSKPDHWRCTVADLEKFRKDLTWAVYEAKVKGEQAKMEKGYWCAFATCKSVCPLHVSRVVAFGQKMAALTEAAEEEKAPLSTMPAFAEMSTELLEMAELAEEWAKAVFGSAQSLLEGGGTVPGWFLKAKRSAGREWAVEPDDVKKFMQKSKVPIDEYMPRSLATMPKCEVILKKRKITIPEDMYRTKPSSGAALARDGDPATPIQPQGVKMTALAEKLAAYATSETDLTRQD